MRPIVFQSFVASAADNTQPDALLLVASLWLSLSGKRLLESSVGKTSGGTRTTTPTVGFSI